MSVHLNKYIIKSFNTLLDECYIQQTFKYYHMSFLNNSKRLLLFDRFFRGIK